VEGADEVLALGEVQGRLPADRRVDLPHERRRHGHPGDPPQVGCCDEPGRVRRAAAPQRDERRTALEAEFAPEALARGDRLRLLADGQLMRRDEPLAERELGGGAVDPGHPWIANERQRTLARHELAEELDGAQPDVDAGGGEHDVVRVAAAGIGGLGVERLPLLVQRSEARLVDRERPVARRDALPGVVDLDVEEDGQRMPPEALAHAQRRRRSAAEDDHGRNGIGERLDRQLLLVLAKGGLAPFGEDLRDRRVELGLELAVEVHERAVEPRRHLRADGGLAGAHETDQGNVPGKRAAVNGHGRTLVYRG
jgi:hypothetical protein